MGGETDGAEEGENWSAPDQRQKGKMVRGGHTGAKRRRS